MSVGGKKRTRAQLLEEVAAFNPAPRLNENQWSDWEFSLKPGRVRQCSGLDYEHATPEQALHHILRTLAEDSSIQFAGTSEDRKRVKLAVPVAQYKIIEVDVEFAQSRYWGNLKETKPCTHATSECEKCEKKKEKLCPWYYLVKMDIPKEHFLDDQRMNELASESLGEQLDEEDRLVKEEEEGEQSI
jgi:hypothetical protein